MMRNCELQTDLCDKRLLSIKVPDKISRPPKSLLEYRRWKGKRDCISCSFHIG